VLPKGAFSLGPPLDPLLLSRLPCFGVPQIRWAVYHRAVYPLQVRCAGSLSCIQGASANVTITDICPECEDTRFDLSQPVFASIAQVQAGSIGLEYRRYGMPLRPHV